MPLAHRKASEASKWEARDVSKTTCPSCGTELAEGQTIAGKRVVDKKAVSICKACAEILVLTKCGGTVAMRAVTASEYLSLNEEAQLRLRVAYALIRQQRPRPERLRLLN
jgi:RNase P subunit RPR2